jgi:hypothetical protein
LAKTGSRERSTGEAFEARFPADRTSYTSTEESAGETKAQVLQASYARGDARNSRRRAPVSIVDLLSTTKTGRTPPPRETRLCAKKTRKAEEDTACSHEFLDEANDTDAMDVANTGGWWQSLRAPASSARARWCFRASRDVVLLYYFFFFFSNFLAI